MPTQHDYQAAEKERAAHERGRSISFYAGKVVKKLASRARRGKLTESKKPEK